MTKNITKMVTLCQQFANFPAGSLRQADKTLYASATVRLSIQVPAL